MKMNFHVLHVLTLFVCLGQICSGSNELNDEMRKRMVKQTRNSIYGVSEQFMDDFMVILDKYRNDPYDLGCFSEMKLIGTIPKEKNSKIDANNLKDYHSTNPYLSRASAAEIAIKIDNVRILRSVLSRQLKPERYNGIVNLFYIFLNANATSEEVETTLGYLYGTDVTATKTSFIKNFPDPNATDCPHDSQRYTETLDKLKSKVDIKPKVVLDFNTIHEKFPCNGIALQFLSRFVHMIELLHGDQSKINACQMNENLGNWQDSSYLNTREDLEPILKEIESILLTRLPDEAFRGIINFRKATIPDTPIDEIEEALDYLYDDKPNCPIIEPTDNLKLALSK